MSWQLTIERVPLRGSRFMVLYADGSGGSVFLRGEDGALVDNEGAFVFDAAMTDAELMDFMIEAEWFYWIDLPDGMTLWFEQGAQK